MWQTIGLSFLAGVMGGNGIPHFVKGITKEPYPNVLGNGPIPNVISGWAALVITALLFHWSRADLHPFAAFASAATGVLLIGLFHAGPGAFGKKGDS
jgi:hypothetical protein